MDKKIKKRIAVLRTRLQRLQKLLSDAKQQCDDPQEITDLELQITEAEKELAPLVAVGAKTTS